MKLLNRLLLLLPWRRRAAERDMRDELRSVAAMASPGELGNLTLTAERARDEWRWLSLEEAAQDARYAIRTLAKRPAFAATVVLSLALAIGANTALFTLVNAVAWRLLPVRDPETLLLLDQRSGPAVTTNFSYSQYRMITGHTPLGDWAASSPVRLNLSVAGGVEPTAAGLLVTGRYFPILGIIPAAGRTLGPDDDRVPLGHPVAMLSYGYWKSRFRLDPAVVGSQITLSGTPFTVVGVTPPEFFGVEVGAAPEIFVPVMMQPAVMPVSENLIDNPINQVPWLSILARLRPGVSEPQVTAALAGLAENEETDWRPFDKFGTAQDPFGRRRIPSTLGLTAAARGLSDLRTRFSTSLPLLIGVVGIMLFIACANTGSLMLTRAATRRSEFALRLALGSGPFRLLRQVLVEGLVLAGLAGVAGIGIAYLATSVLVTYIAAGQGRLVLDLAPDTRVLVFTAVVSTLTGLLFAILPALRASRVELSGAGAGDLRATRHAVSGRGPVRWLIVSEVALSLVLVACAGLFLRSLQHATGRQAGVARDQILLVRVEPRGSDQRSVPGTTERLDRIYRGLIEEAGRIPGVVAASLARTSPLSPLGFGSPVRTAAGADVTVPTLMVYRHYFAAMGQSILKGRDFSDDELRPGARQVAIVNEAFVREVLNGREPLGVSHGAGLVMPGRPPQQMPFEIVGVVKDSPYPDLHTAPRPMLYQTFLQTRTGRGQMVLHVRVSGDPGGVVGRIREVVQAIDRDVPMFEIRTLESEVDAVLVRERLIAVLSGFFGVLALVLVSIGLYGLLSFTVTRRTAEIGVRMALGAARLSVLWMVIRQTLVIAAAGVALGVPLAWIAARLSAVQLSGLLFDLAPTDAATLVLASSVVMLVALAAGWLPARRAARIEPARALRAE